ncbi:MAG: alpha-glucoside transport system substrate-binding protein [Chloroflexota bacterium]|jgi:alpha-glucoside transport system substrate-binding protein|nr:alpha-glucoside transport system substrate-binding protein [Chloroflexota bacterium]
MISRNDWRLRLGVLAVAGVLVVGACGGGATQAPASQPAASQPAASQPAASQPAASQPAASQPAASEPAASEPAASAEVTPAPVACDAAPATGLTQIGGKVSILAVWTGSEQDSFMCMLKPFMDATGIQVDYQGDRNEAALLQTAIQGGSPPDVAGLPGPGVMADFASQGALKPLDDVIDVAAYKADSPPGFVDIGAADGKQIGIFIKASVKGLIWFDPNVYKGGIPTNWDDLQTKATAALADVPGAKTWCVGLESGAASGWPGTDWIEDFVLRQSGPEVYNGWPKGTTKWSSPEIKAAWEAYGQVVSPDAVYGGPTTVVATAFQDGGNPLFTTPPGCLFHHQASFITDFFVKQGGAKPGDYDFFPFPDIKPEFSGVEGGGDLFGMFNDTPQSRALMQYLITPQAQEIWVKRGGAISGSKSVSMDAYPDDISKRSADILANAKNFVFDASDLMSNAVNTKFWSSILEFTKDQTKLDSILTELDSIQSSGG